MATPQTQVEKFKVAQNPPKPDGKAEETLESYILKQLEKYDALGRSSRDRRHYIWTQLDLFSKGIHFTKYDPHDGSIREWDQEDIDACMYTPVPLVEYAVENIASAYTTSKPRIVPSSPSDDRKVKAVVRELQIVADDLFARLYLVDPDERQREAHLAPLRNTVYNFVEYDLTEGPEVTVPNLQEQEQRVCLDCGYEVEDAGLATDGGDGAGASDPRGLDVGSGLSNAVPAIPADTEGACPHCGSPNIEPITGVVDLGPQTMKQGLPIRHVVDAFQVEVYDRRSDPEKSPFLSYDEILFKTEARKLYPWVNIEGQACLGRWDKGFCGLHFLHQIETLVSNTGRLDQSKSDYKIDYGGAYLNELLCWRRRYWLEPSEYAHWPALGKATQLPGTNQLIPAGSTISQMFPDGLLVHMINGTIVKLDNQAKNDVWSCYRFRVPGAGLHGVGAAALVSLNRGYDELTSFQTQAALMAAMGITLVDERVKGFKNIPGEYYTVTQDARLPNEPLSNLVEHKQTGGPSAEVEMVRQGYRQNIADMSMAPSPNSSGLDREGMRTATGVKYQASAVSTLTAPPLELFAANCAKVIEQCVKLEKKHNIRPRFYSDQGRTVSKWIDPMEIPDDVFFMAAEESYQPRTQQTQREDLANAVGMGVGQGKLMPAIEERALQVFGLDSDVDDYADWAVKAETRLDAMKAVAEQVEAIPLDPEEQELLAAQGQDPIELQATAIINKAQAQPRLMDDHAAFMRFYREDLYCRAEWDDLSPALQKSVELLWDAHRAGGVMQAQQQVADTLKAQAPAIEAEKAEIEAQEGKAAGQAEAERATQAEDAERGHQREMEKTDKQHAHEKQLAQMKNTEK